MGRTAGSELLGFEAHHLELEASNGLDDGLL
jgi:hypothetical protein